MAAHCADSGEGRLLFWSRPGRKRLSIVSGATLTGVQAGWLRTVRNSHGAAGSTLTGPVLVIVREHNGGAGAITAGDDVRAAGYREISAFDGSLLFAPDY